MSKPKDTLYVVDHEYDEPVIRTGAFLPPQYRARAAASSVPAPKTTKRRTVQSFTPAPVREQQRQRSRKTATATLAATTLLLVGISAGVYTNLDSSYTVAAPVVAVNTANESFDVLEYGPSSLMSDPQFFAATQEKFAQQDIPYIAVDYEAKSVVYVANGQEKLRAPIVATAAAGTWWDAPAGLYSVTDKKEQHFSALTRQGHAYSLLFQGNFFIHGSSTSPAPSASSTSQGSVQVANDAAATLFSYVTEQTPVLVHRRSAASDPFVYAPTVSDVSAVEYLVADVSNGAVLAASDRTAVRSIASLTKLMTALVAAEQLDLDSVVRNVPERYVITSIPRLEGYGSVSMYTLMQLLLVESSNEAAEVIAAQLGREEFIAAMNRKARVLGLSDTVFTDPSGLDDGNVSSTADLFTLTQFITKNRPFIFELTAERLVMPTYTTEPFGALNNFNEIDGVTSFVGGKIGETAAAGQTNISLHTVTVDGAIRTIAVVLLGADDRKTDITTLLEYVVGTYAGE